MVAGRAGARSVWREDAMAEYVFRLEMDVRDYECDLQGVVNNAVYMNYLEHVRHEFIKTLGLDFAELARRQVNLVVIRAELDYRRPLQSGDRFWVGVRLERLSPLRFAFFQDIYRLPGDQLMLRGKVIGTAVDGRGRPVMPKEVAAALGG
jgi:acyl-CoA thioester hydrolase